MFPPRMWQRRPTGSWGLFSRGRRVARQMWASWMGERLDGEKLRGRTPRRTRRKAMTTSLRIRDSKPALSHVRLARSADEGPSGGRGVLEFAS